MKKIFILLTFFLAFGLQAQMSRNVRLFEPEAVDYIVAVKTLLVNEQGYITFVTKGFKDNGTWDIHDAIYPFTGGTAAEHKWNLKDPRDLDAAFRITWSGTVTHDSEGITGNGSTGYGNTHYIPSSEQTASSSSFQMYCSSENNGGGSDTVDMGVYQSGTQSQNLTINHATQEIGWRRDAGYFGHTSGPGTAQGFTSNSRDGGTAVNSYRDGSSAGSTSNAGTANRPSIAVFILNTNNAGSPYTDGWSNETFSFITIGGGLSTTEMVDDYTVVHNGQKILNREN